MSSPTADRDSLGRFIKGHRPFYINYNSKPYIKNCPKCGRFMNLDGKHICDTTQNIGRKLSMEHRRKLSEAFKGRTPWNKGKKMSDSMRSKLSRTRKKLFKEGKLKIWNKNKSYKKGEEHWNWKGGITSVNRRIRSGFQWKKWREEVFSRDNYTCQICGATNCELHPHHILERAKFPELQFEVYNGITLCKECHYNLHFGGNQDELVHKI